MEPSLPPTARRSRRSFLWAVGGAAVGLTSSVLYKQWRATRLGLTGQPMPPLASGGTWLNTDRPLTPDNLRGNVVFMQFSFIGCGPCRMMMPYLARWHAEFGPRGLVVIEIDDGKSDSLDDVHDWIAREKVAFPVLHDTAGAVCQQFGIATFPSMYLFGRDGNCVWEGGGWGGDERTAVIERRIEQTLAETMAKAAT